MPTRRPSARPSPASGARSPLGRTIEAGLREAAEHVRCRAALREYAVHVPQTADPAAMRAALGLSQAAFAERFGLDVTALQAWEQGRRQPDRTARILLAVIAHEPDAVRRTLSELRGAGASSERRVAGSSRRDV